MEKERLIRNIGSVRVRNSEDISKPKEIAGRMNDMNQLMEPLYRFLKLVLIRRIRMLNMTELKALMAFRVRLSI